ncbi:MAG TPA: UDP-N-acetylmuramate dehydrogenase [Acidobacteriaceae bacterium]|nr:UDP-N-acetylmuramate dehydrogenase [Acidobacteriaceae bacterium]
MEFREQVPLAPYTTFRIGGPARWFAEAASEAEILEAVEFAREHGLPLFALGGGSNVLAADAGYPGLVMRVALKGIVQQGDAFEVGAGEDWDGFVAYAVERGYAGIECLAGIPGTVGGTPIQNVGAYGQEVAETVAQVRALHVPTLEFVEFANAECGFAYRRSIFNSTERGKYIVTRVRYVLRKDGTPRVAYADLKKYFQDSAEPSLEEVSAAVREIRRGKGMYIVEGDPDSRSAGSFFKNPVISAEHFAKIATQEGSEVPHYPAGDSAVKLPAAWLLERAGFHKGYAMGAAGISSRHTLALINRGGASAADIFALRDKIVATVEERFGVRLEPEPVLIG